MDQTEKAFQKQDAVFIGSKRLLGKKTKKARALPSMRAPVPSGGRNGRWHLRKQIRGTANLL